MSTIVLEQIEPEIQEPEPIEQIVSEEPDLPESLEQEAVPSVPPVPTPTETPAPAPKKRGRPPKTLRSVYNHVATPDMETAILQFFVNRKQAESTRRRELWGRLAQM